MAMTHTPSDNIFYDLVAIEYHALKGAQLCDQYAKDAADHDDVRQFIEQVRREDIERATRSHELIMRISPESKAMAGSR
jgi:hypothetical protein